ncbi:PREDICTED: histone-lysine N-methyltransferase SETMAR-like, partial [Dinoponera quadriceps]|uniref:Histone-lysine N-methyltransferase SETMAR-like n=1 Tax=Dinoponera quadriceps TaxID=609295 RepID=A0A6P3Y4Y3_DINQU
AEGVKPSVILRKLEAPFGDNTLKKTQVYKWYKQFLEGRESIENEGHRRRPRTRVTEENIRLVGSLIEGDRRLTVAEIASVVRISFGSVQAIITDDLGFRNVSARWVPRLLTENQKRHCLKVCEWLLTRSQAEGEAFLYRIVTCDETWVHHYTPESKEASMEWRKKSESALIKVKTRLSAGKVLATVFLDFK